MTVVAVGGTLPTLLEQAKTHGQFGEVLPIVNTLAKATPLVSRSYWEQSNMPNGQLTVRVTGKPTGSIRRVNQSIAPSKATYDQVTEVMTEYATLSKVDPSALKGFGSPMQERARLVRQHPVVLGEMLETDIIYGSTADGNGEFDGFMVRPELSALGDQCLGAGGTGGGSVYASILLVYWGSDTCKIVYPKGTLAGVQHVDHGLALTPTTTGTDSEELPMWKDWFSITAGVSIPNPLSVVRCANIVTSDVKGVAGTQQLTDYTTNLVYRTAEMLDRVPETVKQSGRGMWIVPRSVKSGLNIQVLAHTFSNVFQRGQIEANGSQNPDTWYGLPMAVSDQMTYTEAEVS